MGFTNTVCGLFFVRAAVKFLSDLKHLNNVNFDGLLIALGNQNQWRKLKSWARANPCKLGSSLAYMLCKLPKNTAWCPFWAPAETPLRTPLFRHCSKLQFYAFNSSNTLSLPKITCNKSCENRKNLNFWIICAYI